MDTDTLVESLIDGGQALVNALVQHGFDVAAAFWLKATDDKWRFCIVSPVVDAQGTNQAYRQIHPVAWAMRQPFSIDPLTIKVIGQGNPLAQDVMAAHGRLHVPPSQPIRWRGAQLGNISVDGAYLYPVPTPIPTP